MTRRALLMLAVLWAALSGAAALGQGRDAPPSGAACGPEALRWVARCNASRGAGITLVECPAPGLFVLSTLSVRVELARDPARGFRRAHAWGLSPVGLSGEWTSIPAPTRDAFEKIVACAEADDTLPATNFDPSAQTTRARSGGPSERNTADASPVRVPWRALMAAALLLAAWWPLRRRRGVARRVLMAAGLCAGAVALRWMVFSPGFFHQNGQGPMWVAVALGDWQPYGPGYPELFGAAAALSPAYPDVTIFFAQSVLAALGLCAAYGLARRSGVSASASSLTAAALTLCLLVNPTLGRLSRSESYFSLCLSLELLAAWALTLGGPLRGSAVARLRALAPTLAAGLLLSLCVAVHPIAWVPAAMVPLVTLVGPGSLRRRARRAAIAYAVVGAVVLATALPGVLRVVHGELGQRWIAHGHEGPGSPSRTLAALMPWIAFLTVMLATARRRVRSFLRALVALPVILVIPATDVVTASGVRVYLSSAFLWLHAPVLLAVLASTLSDVPRARWQAWAMAGVVALGGVAFAVKNYRPLTALATDTMEQRDAMRWRDRLPDGATVWFLSRAGNHILSLPLYTAKDPRGRRLISLDARNEAPVLMGDLAYWYHSSACSTEGGRAYCEAVERGAALEPVLTATLPAIWSLQHVPFDRERVPVGLFRVRSAAPR